MVAPTLSHPVWNPTKIRRVDATHPTGTQAVSVTTDAGPGVAKFMGNTEGPHVLAAEFIGTRLAALLGLQIFEYAILTYDGVPEIVLASGVRAQSGPVWITRREEGINWSGSSEHLDQLSNPSDLAGLVVLDSWIRNCDRHCPARKPARVNRGNVFFSRLATREGTFRLVAMDHTHVITCGRPLTPAVSQIDFVKDETVYGLFPEFVDAIEQCDLQDACTRLAAISKAAIIDAVTAVPTGWAVDTATRHAITELLIERRNFVAESLTSRVFPQIALP